MIFTVFLTQSNSIIHHSCLSPYRCSVFTSSVHVLLESKKWVCCALVVFIMMRKYYINLRYWKFFQLRGSNWTVYKPEKWNSKQHTVLTSPPKWLVFSMQNIYTPSSGSTDSRFIQTNARLFPDPSGPHIIQLNHVVQSTKTSRSGQIQTSERLTTKFSNITLHQPSHVRLGTCNNITQFKDLIHLHLRKVSIVITYNHFPALHWLFMFDLEHFPSIIDFFVLTGQITVSLRLTNLKHIFLSQYLHPLFRFHLKTFLRQSQFYSPSNRFSSNHRIPLHFSNYHRLLNNLVT